MIESDQPDGIDPEGYELPIVENAARRVSEFLSWHGDGMVDLGLDVEYPHPPLYSRDLQALLNAAERLEGLVK